VTRRSRRHASLAIPAAFPSFLAEAKKQARAIQDAKAWARKLGAPRRRLRWLIGLGTAAIVIAGLLTL
jgi:hypothetical protein